MVITNKGKIEMEEARYDKLIQLHDNLKAVKKQKKSMNNDYRDQIKEIEAEISDVVEEIKELKAAK